MIGKYLLISLIIYSYYWISCIGCIYLINDKNVSIGIKNNSIAYLMMIISFCYSIISYIILYKILNIQDNLSENWKQINNKIYWVNIMIGLSFLIVSISYFNKEINNSSLEKEVLIVFYSSVSIYGLLHIINIFMKYFNKFNIERSNRRYFITTI